MEMISKVNYDIEGEIEVESERVRVLMRDQGELGEIV